jgi:hypothetical protein
LKAPDRFAIWKGQFSTGGFAAETRHEWRGWAS